MRKADNPPPACADVMKSGALNLLESCGPVQACNWTALPLYTRLHLAPCQPDVRSMYEGWNFISGNYLFTTDTK